MSIYFTQYDSVDYFDGDYSDIVYVYYVEPGSPLQVVNFTLTVVNTVNFSLS